MKRKVIIFTCISLCLSSFQVTNNQSAVAATICSGLGAAAYPPDLPDCLDPVVAAKQAEDLEVSVRASAAASASRAAQDGGTTMRQQPAISKKKIKWHTRISFILLGMSNS